MDKHLNPQDPENMLGYIDALADDLESLGTGQELRCQISRGLRLLSRAWAAQRSGRLVERISPSAGADYLTPRLWFAGLGGWRRDAGGCSSHSGNTEETLSSLKRQ